MGHYKPYKRLAERTSYTPSEWYRTCSELGTLVNVWSKRSDLVVYGGDDSANGEAIAAFYHDSAEVEVNVNKAFAGYTSEGLGDLRVRANQYKIPQAIGVIYHEALHARYTNWDKNVLSDLEPAVGRAFMLLEEPRIEARGIIDNPDNKLFLRESALKFALEEITQAQVDEVSEIWQGAMLGVLAIGRFDSGVLDFSDVKPIYNKLLDLLGKELFDKLRSLWVEFLNLTPSGLARGVEIAEEWVSLLREADPEGEGGFGMVAMFDPEGDESESGDSESQPTPSGLGKMLEEIAEQVSAQNSRSLEEQQTSDEYKEEAEKRKSEAKRKNEKRSESQRVFDKSNDPRGAGSSSTLESKRPPTADERISAVALAKSLERAKYRERSQTEVRSSIPMGRLNFRATIQNKANEARGSNLRLPNWDRTVRKHNDDPTLRLGVMVDISGSMGSAMESMATTAWVLSEAGRRIQAKTAMVYYGSGVFPTLRVGERLDEVRVFSAPDGTEEFGKAYDSLDGELNLTNGDGVRLLVIVSDGNYRSDQTSRAIEALKECRRAGVAVLWVSPKDCHWRQGARSIVEDSAWGIHLDGLDVSEIATEVGKTASQSLAQVGASV